MSISNRINAFFLSALALVLIVFSVVVYFLIETRLRQQLEDRATATIEVISSACEWNVDGLSFRPAHHDITFQNESEPTIWAIFDETGHRLDNSSEPFTFSVDVFPDLQVSGVIVQQSFTWMNQPWQIFQKKLVHPNSQKRRDVATPNRYMALTIMTAWPERPINETLMHLSEFLLIVSTGVWTTSALLGRWFCRKALSPLSAVADKVRGVRAADLSRRLDVPHSRDELQDLAVAFNELMGRLEDSFARQSRFAGEASHQLRTPLAAILGQIEVTLRRNRDVQEYQQILLKTKFQVLKLQKIVESLLFLARRDSDCDSIQTEPLELNSWIVEHVADSWSHHKRYDELKLQLVPEVQVILTTHQAMLAQALDNYIDNALKYSKPGNPIIIGLEIAQNQLVIYVQDHGDGIPENERTEVFMPFFRSASAHFAGTDGFGLGLSIVARITNSLGGQASVISKVGEGSRFQLIFPADRFEIRDPGPAIESDSVDETDVTAAMTEL